MSFTNETTHYSIPLPLGTDLTTPMDYNEAAQAVDTALFGAVQDAAAATQDASDAKATAQGAAGDVLALSGRLADDEATIASQGNAITGLQNGVADVRADLSDAIEAVKEPTATATYAHAVNDLFWYNDTLYRTTAPIAIGDTIVPDTNCTTTTVATELARIEAEIATPTAADVTFDPTGTDLTATNSQSAIVEVNGKVNDKIGSPDYSQKVSVIETTSAVLNYTVLADGWLFILSDGTSFAPVNISIDGTHIATAANSVMLPVLAGQVVSSGAGVVRIAFFYPAA